MRLNKEGKFRNPETFYTNKTSHIWFIFVSISVKWKKFLHKLSPFLCKEWHRWQNANALDINTIVIPLASNKICMVASGARIPYLNHGPRWQSSCYIIELLLDCIYFLQAPHSYLLDKLTKQREEKPVVRIFCLQGDNLSWIRRNSPY